MIRAFYLTILICLAGIPAFTQPVMKADTSDEVIRSIREEYARINADSAKMRIEQHDVEGQSTEGGEVIRYYEGKNLRKAIALNFGERGRNREEYYFRNGRLLFAYIVYYHYNIPMYRKGSKVDRKEENRYYFNTDGTLIRWVDPHGRIADRSLYPAKRKEVMEWVKEVY